MIQAFGFNDTTGQLELLRDGQRTRGGQTVGHIIELAALALARGVSKEEIQQEAADRAGVALFEWPAPAAGKTLDRWWRYLDPNWTEAERAAALVGLPLQRFFVGDFAVFAFLEVDTPPPPPPVTLTDVQLFEGLLIEGVISIDEFEAWALNDALPAAFVAAITAHVTATLPAGERQVAGLKIAKRLRADKTFPRDHPFIAIMQDLRGLTHSQMDTFYSMAGAL